MNSRYWGLLALASVVASIPICLTGCGPTPAASASAGNVGGGISPKAFADGVHAVMMADRTVYAKQVVTRLKKQTSPVKPNEYWQDDDGGHSIPLPAQMFRMGAEIVSENAEEAGFTYSLKSLWPLNAQHEPSSDFEREALQFLADNPGENFYKEEELGGKKYYTAMYPDRAEPSPKRAGFVTTSIATARTPILNLRKVT